MKTAIIEDGKVIVMTCMDRRKCGERIQGFYETRPFDNLETTNCRWIFEDQIKEEVENAS